MNISGPFIRRPVGTILLSIGVMLAGIVAYILLPVASLPSVDFPTINVQATRPGADTNTTAATVAAPRVRGLPRRGWTLRAGPVASRRHSALRRG